MRQVSVGCATKTLQLWQLPLDLNHIFCFLLNNSHWILKLDFFFHFTFMIFIGFCKGWWEKWKLILGNTLIRTAVFETGKKWPNPWHIPGTTNVPTVSIWVSFHSWLGKENGNHSEAYSVLVRFHSDPPWQRKCAENLPSLVRTVMGIPGSLSLMKGPPSSSPSPSLASRMFLAQTKPCTSFLSSCRHTFRWRTISELPLESLSQ